MWFSNKFIYFCPLPCSYTVFSTHQELDNPGGWRRSCASSNHSFLNWLLMLHHRAGQLTIFDMLEGKCCSHPSGCMCSQTSGIWGTVIYRGERPLIQRLPFRVCCLFASLERLTHIVFDGRCTVTGIGNKWWAGNWESSTNPNKPWTNIGHGIHVLH